MKGSYLGPSYSNSDVRKMAKKNKAKLQYFEDFGELTKIVANKLFEGNAVGWMQGRMEFGPRALGAG